jgi:hypothetical protein
MDAPSSFNPLKIDVFSTFVSFTLIHFLNFGVLKFEPAILPATYKLFFCLCNFVCFSLQMLNLLWKHHALSNNSDVHASVRFF